MGMTRATFLIAVALVLSLVVAAAGIGAYIAVRQNATAQNAIVEDPAGETRSAAALHGIEAPAVPVEPSTDPGMVVESTEQVVGSPEQVVESPEAADDRPAEAERPQPRRSPATAPAPGRPATRPAAPAATRALPRREPPRPAREAIERPAPRPVPTAARSEPEPEPEPEPAVPTVRRQDAAASRELPAIEGWRPAEPSSSTAVRNTRVPGETADLPPPAPAILDPPTPGADAEPRLPLTEELVIPADSVIGLQIDTFVTTDDAEVEDDVRARVTRDVMVSRRVVIPAGSLVEGSVVMVDRGGKLQGASRLGVRFHTVVLDNGIEVPIATETVYREGRSRGRDNAARIGGGAVAGAILGAIFGGGRGAAIGGAAGAAGGTAAAAAGDAEPATLAAGTTLTVRLARPGTVTVER